jgi:hypothetical protein
MKRLACWITLKKLKFEEEEEKEEKPQHYAMYHCYSD